MARRVHESIEAQAPLQNVFSYWSFFENFPKVMRNIEEVRLTGQGTSHRKVKGPLGISVDFDTRTTEMDPSRSIGWNSIEGEVRTSGEVRFEEVATGRTRMNATMDYADPPGGKVGEVAANVLSDPEREIGEDPENFAGMVERGELGGPGSQAPSR